MTNDQYKKLADKLAGTTLNVYQLAGAMFGHDWTDEDFDRLEGATGLFRCEQCDRWREAAQKDEDVDVYCKECVDRMDGESSSDQW